MNNAEYIQSATIMKKYSIIIFIEKTNYQNLQLCMNNQDTFALTTNKEELNCQSKNNELGLITVQ